MNSLKADMLNLSELIESNLSQANSLISNAHLILIGKEASLHKRDIANQLVTAKTLVHETEKLCFEVRQIIKENLTG